MHKSCVILVNMSDGHELESDRAIKFDFYLIPKLSPHPTPYTTKQAQKI